MPAGWTRTPTASGRYARTTTPSSASCAPSTPCGFAPSSTVKSSPTQLGGTRRSNRLRSVPQQALDPRDRNADPVGAIVELVAQLVHRLLELVHREEPL